MQAHVQIVFLPHRFYVFFVKDDKNYREIGNDSKCRHNRSDDCEKKLAEKNKVDDSKFHWMRIILWLVFELRFLTQFETSLEITSRKIGRFKRVKIIAIMWIGEIYVRNFVFNDGHESKDPQLGTIKIVIFSQKIHLLLGD